MPNIRTKDLTLLSSVDAAVDAILIEDISANETKKTTANILKTSMLLDNVDNTSDVNKPISTATQAALDGKVDENAAITGATKTKITYDSKGLVTAGDDLAASDIPTGIDAAKIGAGSVDNTEFGYLNGVTSAIQTQLNAKQGSLTLTTTGSSGAATLVGNTLNIPQYSGGSGSGVSSLEGLTGALQLVAGSNVTITDNGTDTITISASGGGGGVAWGGITGTLSNQTDLQTALDGKVDENAAITGATKTKITYDAKGLVTAGDDLSASDMPTGIDATKIGAGSVSNTEFGYLDGVTSAIQTQIDTKTNKLITANRQTASYTLVASDADKLVEMNVASANNLTVPASVFSAGTQILLAQYGAGQTTIVAGSGMTIRSNGGKLKLSAQYSGATLVFISGTEAYLFGDITA